MSNKKTILVILLAAILAFLAVLFVFNPTKTSVKKEDVIEEVIEPTAPAIVEEEKIEESTAEEEEIKPEIKPVAKPTPVKVSTPVIKQIQVEEAKEAIKEETSKEIQVDAGIIKESGSNDIVITREFKSKSPTKYSFEGYGVQKAPIK